MKMALYVRFALGLLVSVLTFHVSFSQGVVRTKTGNVLGSNRKFNGTRYRAFTGIPYAESPVGSRRFSPPVAKISLDASGTLNAKSYGPSCPQEVSASAAFSPYFFARIPREAMEISEDCLTLNVYAPSTDVQTGPTWPVMVWIHGGGYRSGQGSAYDAAPLAVQNVVVVTINYRLGPFGFLYTADENAPGNLGLMDQQLAMEWVQDNIKAFGGDPNRVTLFGQSDVHGSPSLHVFAKDSRQLFHRLIAHTGVFQSGELQQSTDAISDTKLFAELAECPITESSSLVECLRGKTVDELLATDRLFSRKKGFSYAWRPVFTSEFFIKDPIGPPKYDLISVFSSGEGSISLELLKDLYPDMKPGFAKGITEERWKRFLDTYIDRSPLMHIAIDRQYINGLSNNFARLQVLVNAELERRYARHGEKPLTDLRSVISSSHLVVFDHRSSTDNRYPGLNLVPHGSELAYVFGLPFGSTRTQFTDDERELSQRMITYWANFAKTGNPDNAGGEATNDTEPNWPESGPSRKYLQAQLQGAVVGATFRRQGVNFWNGYLNELTGAAEESCRSESQEFDLTPQQAQATIQGLMSSLIAVIVVGLFAAATALRFWLKGKKKSKPENRPTEGSALLTDSEGEEDKKPPGYPWINPGTSETP